jgi:Icc protein
MICKDAATPASTMTTLRLVQFTDTHLLTEPTARFRGMRTRPSLEACIADASRRAFPADAIVVTGDLVQDEPEAYGWLELLLAPLGTPVLLIPGNHDLPDEIRRRFSQRPFQAGGTFVLGSWLLVMLDTWLASSRDGEGRLGSAALEALDATLSARADRHVLVALHHPPVAMGATALDALGLVDADAFTRIVDRHVCVKGVVWGHAHQGLDVYRGAVRWMCTPSTCMQFRPRTPKFEIDNRPPGYRTLDLHADGSLSSEVIWLEGYEE